MAKMPFVFTLVAIVLSTTISQAQTSQPDGGGVRSGAWPQSQDPAVVVLVAPAASAGRS